MDGNEARAFTARLGRIWQLVERVGDTGDTLAQSIACLLNGVGVGLGAAASPLAREGTGKNFSIPDE
ncbi:MAG: hypothetical protein WDN30_05235 [Pararobbsia sp.]